MKFPGLKLDLSIRSQHCLKLAKDHAKQNGRSTVTTADLLFGLMKIGQGMHWLAFEENKINTEELFTDTKALTSDLQIDETAEYSSDLINVFKTAERYSNRRNKTLGISTGHLLVALMHSDVSGLLEKYGLTDQEKIASQVERFLNEPWQTRFSPLRLVIDPGSAPPEVIAGILSDISTLYRLKKGSGITFEVQGVYSLNEVLW